MSERGLHDDIVDEIQKQVVKPALLTEMVFPTGTVNIWTGQGSITWDSKTWTGTEKLIGISSISERTDGSVQGLQITVSGVDSDLISDAAEDEFQGSKVGVWIAFLTSNGAVVEDPFKLFSGHLDTAEIKDNGKQASITINAENRLIDQLRPIQYRYTDQDQQKLYPGDKGFEFISTIQDRQIVWRS